MAQPAPRSRVVLQVAFRTDPGLDPEKQVNEDACAYREVALGHVLVVCDGMGGHVSGREASNRAVATIVGDLEHAAFPTAPPVALRQAIEHAGALVFELGGSGPNPLRPGSTCVSLLVHAGGTEVAHVGDSRAYLIRGPAIYPLTRDHSMVQQMIDAGVLAPQEAIGHPDANKITRALGMGASVEVEVRPTPLAHTVGDVFLLATDGLSDLVMPEDMLSVVTQARSTGGLAHACEQLVALANARGGHDNITVLLAEVVEAPPAAAVQPTIVGSASDTVPPDATMPEMPALGSPHTGTVGATMIDDGSQASWSYGQGEPGAPPSPGPPAQSEPEAAWRSRRALWIGIGLGLVLAGVVLVVLSVWLALAAGSQRDEAPAGGSKLAATCVTPNSRCSGAAARMPCA